MYKKIFEPIKQIIYINQKYSYKYIQKYVICVLNRIERTYRYIYLSFTFCIRPREVNPIVLSGINTTQNTILNRDSFFFCFFFLSHPFILYCYIPSAYYLVFYSCLRAPLARAKVCFCVCDDLFFFFCVSLLLQNNGTHP